MQEETSKSTNNFHTHTPKPWFIEIIPKIPNHGLANWSNEARSGIKGHKEKSGGRSSQFTNFRGKIKQYMLPLAVSHC